MNRRERIVLRKLLAETAIIAELTGGYSLAEFLNDEKIKRAVGMTLINIGELVKTLSPEFRITHHHIPWALRCLVWNCVLEQNSNWCSNQVDHGDEVADVSVASCSCGLKEAVHAFEPGV